MIMNKKEAMVINDMTERDKSFDYIRNKFRKIFKKEFPFENEPQMLRELEKRLKVDKTKQFIKISNEENLYWNINGINKKCFNCKKECKQHAGCVIIHCENYTPVI